jgi:anti-anti-sigma regulatory factor
MAQVTVSHTLPKKALVTRASARVLADALRAASATGDHEIVVDFSGVEAVTPSFVDELYRLIDELRQSKPGKVSRLKLTNIPTRLSAGFAAIGRSHGTAIAEPAPNVWTSTWGQP